MYDVVSCGVILIIAITNIVKGWLVGKLRQQQQALGRKMDSAVPRLWYDKIQAGLMPTSARKREEEKGGLCSLPELGCLATYIGHVPRALICLC